MMLREEFLDGVPTPGLGVSVNSTLEEMDAAAARIEAPRHMAHAPDVSTNVVKHDYSIVVFVNIDWKKSRHDNKKVADKNLDLLKGTVRSIIKTHKPVVICFCEVGESSQPMTSSQMLAVSEVIEATWKQLLQSTVGSSFFSRKMRLTCQHTMHYI